MSSPAKDSKSGQKESGSKSKVEITSPKTTLELLEEDDEFQEFDVANWEDAKLTEKEDNQLWKDDWDDDGVEDSFNEQLRAQIKQTTK